MTFTIPPAITKARDGPSLAGVVGTVDQTPLDRAVELEETLAEWREVLTRLERAARWFAQHGRADPRYADAVRRRELLIGRAFRCRLVCEHLVAHRDDRETYWRATMPDPYTCHRLAGLSSAYTWWPVWFDALPPTPNTTADGPP